MAAGLGGLQDLAPLSGLQILSHINVTIASPEGLHDSNYSWSKLHFEHMVFFNAEFECY